MVEGSDFTSNRREFMEYTGGVAAGSAFDLSEGEIPQDIVERQGVPPFPDAEMFLDVDGIQGEATTPQHRNEIDVFGWRWGIGNVRADAVDSRTLERAAPTRLRVSKFLDKATPKLLESATTNVRHSQAVLTLRTAGTNAVDFFTLAMNGVSVLSIGTGGESGEDGPMEQVEFEFDRIEIAYRPLQRNGSAGEPVTFSWTVGEGGGGSGSGDGGGGSGSGDGGGGGG